MITNTPTLLKVSVGSYYNGLASDFVIGCTTETGVVIPTVDFGGAVTKVATGLFTVEVNIATAGNYILSVMSPALSTPLYIPFNVADPWVSPFPAGVSQESILLELWRINGLDKTSPVLADDLKRTVKDSSGVPIIEQVFTDDGVTDTMVRTL